MPQKRGHLFIRCRVVDFEIIKHKSTEEEVLTLAGPLDYKSSLNHYSYMPSSLQLYATMQQPCVHVLVRNLLVYGCFCLLVVFTMQQPMIERTDNLCSDSSNYCDLNSMQTLHIYLNINCVCMFFLFLRNLSCTTKKHKLKVLNPKNP